MGLEAYIKKRKFNKTPEPKGKYEKKGNNRFVIQRHDASRLHYDLRLEMEGVLKSWAVPKGPSMNPDDKRLSIETEDHPVKYLSFEGVIPKGNYGAGVMEIWDEGEYQIYSDESGKTPIEQWKDGNLKIEFFGKKIKGKFALVHIDHSRNKNHWLLIKKSDKHATDLDYDAENFIAPKFKEKASKASSESQNIKIRKLTPEKLIKPMLATLGKEAFSNPEWIYELKWDGYRVLSYIKDGKVGMYSRNGKSYNDKFAPLLKELNQIEDNVILDGEVVILDKNGASDFQAIQNYDVTTSDHQLHYYVFDILHLNGKDTHSLPLNDRKSLIPEIIEDMENVRYCDHVESLGKAFFDRAIEMRMEGIIAKKKDSKYYPGNRSEHWLKIKAVDSVETVICGYTDSDKQPFGSFILGMYKNGELSYMGNCGTGFTDEEQVELLKKMDRFERKTSPFVQKIDLKGRKANWITPKLIAEIKFSEYTKTGKLRHPVFKGLREDKTLQQITPQKEIDTQEKMVSKDKKSVLELDGYEVPVSSLNKVYWPKSGLTKFDLINYYIKMSDHIMPYMINRPQNLHRHPNGIDEQGFYQKDQDIENLPEWADTVAIYSESGNKEIDYLLCQNGATLIWMANLGCIEMNPWNCTKDDLDHPDYTVIDLDPSDKNTFEEVIEIAQVVKEVLDRAKIKGYCKTSGSSGLHVYIPLNAQYTFDEARNFTKLLCHYVHDLLPELTSLERAVKKRKGKIYLDYMQNRPGQTLAAAYCVRPKKGATVSAPLAWEEVKKGLKREDFNVHTMEGRVKERGDLFKGVLKKGIDMEKAIEQLEK